VVIGVALLVIALVLFALAAAGVVHQRVQFVPLGLAFWVLAVLLRAWPP
jgi:hypothetical protein